MNPTMIAESIFFGISLWATLYNLVLINRIVLPAIKNKILKARARSYSFNKEPVRFVLGILFWLVIFTLMLFSTYLIGSDLWGKVKL
jgi:hypothetical protein